MLVCGRDPCVGGPSPKPAVNIDGLEMFGVAAFPLEVTLASGRVDGADIV